MNFNWSAVGEEVTVDAVETSRWTGIDPSRTFKFTDTAVSDVVNAAADAVDDVAAAAAEAEAAAEVEAENRPWLTYGLIGLIGFGGLYLLLRRR